MTAASATITFKLATNARACGFRVKRNTGLIDGLPIDGAAASVEIEDRGNRHTASRVAAGVIGGAVFLPLALVGFTKKDGRQLHVTVTAADGTKATRIVPGSRHQMVVDFVNRFNAFTGSIQPV